MWEPTLDKLVIKIYLRNRFLGIYLTFKLKRGDKSDPASRRI